MRITDRCGVIFIVFIMITIVFLCGGLPLILILTGHSTKDPEFSVIDASISSFNLTSDDRLLWVFNIVLRVYNPDSKDAQSFSNQDVSVRKGKHHHIADDGFLGFRQDPLNTTLLRAEAVAIYKQLERKIAAELREDMAYGAGLVNVYLNGEVGSNILEVTCMNVLVPFSKSMAMFPMVDCGVGVYDPGS